MIEDRVYTPTPRKACMVRPNAKEPPGASLPGSCRDLRLADVCYIWLRRPRVSPLRLYSIISILSRSDRDLSGHFPERKECLCRPYESGNAAVFIVYTRITNTDIALTGFMVTFGLGYGIPAIRQLSATKFTFAMSSNIIKVRTLDAKVKRLLETCTTYASPAARPVIW